MNEHINPRMKILRHPYIVAHIKARQSVRPINIEFDVSNRCNLACRFCDFGYTHDDTIMPLTLAKRIIEQLALFGVNAITFTGGGEPTTNPDFAEIVRCAWKAGLDIGMYTNGVDISRIADDLDFFTWIYVSLDEATADAYRVMKARDMWPTVTRNIQIMSMGTTVGCGFLLHADNYQRIGSMIDIAHDCYADYVQFRPIVGLSDYSWIPEALCHLAMYDHDTFVSYNPDRFNDMVHWERGYTICRGSELVPCVGADGTLWACPNMRGKQPLGNLRDDTFEDIWSWRETQMVTNNCRICCRNHELNKTLEYVCGNGEHDNFV